MAFRVLPLLLLLVCAATLLHAGVVSDDDNESETDAPTSSATSDEGLESPEYSSIDELPFESEFRRKRSAVGVEEAKTPAADNTKLDEKKTVAVSAPASAPVHERTRREDSSKKVEGSPSVPQTVNKNQEEGKKLSTIPENARVVRAAQGQSTRGASSGRSAPAPVATNSKSKVASPAANNKKTAPSGPTSGKKPA